MKKLIYALFFTCSAAVLISWGVTGHKTVAMIAENHLSPNAKAAVSAYLGGDHMSDVSSWADEVINEPEYQKTAPWHYLNVTIGLSFADFAKAVKGQSQDNVYSALLKNESILKDPASKPADKVIALKFVIHLVGDLHQPMHISRAEDKGGNTIPVTFDGKDGNLHSLWDSRLISHQGMSAAQMAIAYDNATPAQIKLWQSEDLMKWLYESYQISTKLYAEVENSSKLDEDYYKNHIPIVQQRIEMGGIRLAGILNEIFKTAKPVKIEDVAVKAPAANEPPAVAIKIEDVDKHIGEKVTIVSKMYGYKALDGLTLIDLGAENPDQLLTVVLRGKAVDAYKDLNLKTISVTGKLVLYKGKPEIIITEPGDISLKGN